MEYFDAPLAAVLASSGWYFAFLRERKREKRDEIKEIHEMLREIRREAKANSEAIRTEIRHGFARVDGRFAGIDGRFAGKVARARTEKVHVRAQSPPPETSYQISARPAQDG